APTYKEYWNLYWPGRPVQLLNNAGSTNSPAGLQYAVSTSNTAAPTDGWTDDYTAVTGNIGTNYVWYKVDATDGYNAVEPTCMSGSATVGLNSESVILPGTVVSSDKPLRLKEFKGYRYGANATEEYLEGYGTDNTTNKTWTADVPYVLVDYPTSSSSYYEVRLRKAVLLSDLIGDNTEFPINMNNQPWETGYALINDTDINARFEDYHDYYERSDGTGSYGSSVSSYLRPYGAVGGGNGINYCVIDKIEYDYQYSGSTEKVYKVTVYYPTVLPQTVDDQKAAYNREKTVSAFELPTSEYGTWTWEDPDLDITAVGTYTPTAVFTTNDPKKYKSKTQEVTVNVVPAVDFNDSTATVWTDEDDKDGSTVTYTTIEKGDEFYSNKELTFTGATALGSEIGDGVYQYYISKVTSGVSLVTVNHSHTYAYSTADNGYQLIGTCTTEEGNVQDTIAELTVTADEPLKDGQITYTDNYTVEVGDYTISSKEFYKKSGSSYNYSGTAAPTDAGEYKVKVTVTINGANYALERPFTIERKDITAADYNAQTVTIGDYINSGDEYDGEN
ncbi:MAG: hypothetical protein IJ555_08560, partial [Ruminococcus sp.]|nr:hypothetical protein [Ruminococcus sp.]